MKGGSFKIKPPNSHPSNPIYKQVLQAQRLVKNKKPKTQATADSGVLATQAPATDSVDPHHVNKALVAVGALVLVRLVVWART